MTRRDFLRDVGTGAAAFGLAAGNGCATRRPDKDAQGRPILTVWHPWIGVNTPKIEKVLRDFQAAHPHIALRALFVPNDIATNQKFFTAVAAGKPPDAIFVDGPQVAEWAERGALQKLDNRIDQAGIRPEDYWTPCWKQTTYRGSNYALTYGADPNFAFAWNKSVFRDVGLDPNHGPESIEELDAFCEKIAKWEGTKLVRMGVIPWIQHGSANSMYTWGWAFGGEFFDEKTQRIVADNPKTVKALDWMVSHAEKYHTAAIMGLQQGFGTAQLDPFYTGQMAMRCLHVTGVFDIQRYAPKLDYGLGFLPYPADGERHSSWVGGWCMAIPVGSRHPEEAWEMIRYLCHDPAGTEMTGRGMSYMPGCKNSPAFAALRTTPSFEQYYQILQETRHQRPVMPVQAYFNGSIQRAVDSAIYGMKTAQRALKDATEETQAELDIALKAA